MAATCTDSDGGKLFGKKGSVTTEQSGGGTLTTFDDCFDTTNNVRTNEITGSGYLKEHYCENSARKEEKYPIIPVQTCKDGAITPICEETDVFNDYKERGDIFINGVRKEADYCKDSDGIIKEKVIGSGKLTEFYCLGSAAASPSREEISIQPDEACINGKLAKRPDISLTSAPEAISNWYSGSKQVIVKPVCSNCVESLTHLSVIEITSCPEEKIKYSPAEKTTDMIVWVCAMGINSIGDTVIIGPIKILIDKTAPATKFISAITSDGAPYSSGMPTNKEVLVTLNCDDKDGIGCKSTDYCWCDTCELGNYPDISNYPATIKSERYLFVSGSNYKDEGVIEGSCNLWAKSKDQLDKEETSTNVFTINIDKTPPTISSFSVTPSGPTNNKIVNVGGVFSDAESGLSGYCQLKIYKNGNAISTSGNEWYPKVSCTSETDLLPIDLSTLGGTNLKYKFELKVTDKAGNYKISGQTEEVFYDIIEPTTTPTTGGVPTSPVRSTAITLACNPLSGSECLETKYCLADITNSNAGCTLSKYTGSIDAGANVAEGSTKKFKIYYSSTDKAGNIENTQNTPEIIIDKTPPTISSFSVTFPNPSQTQYTKTSVVKVTGQLYDPTPGSGTNYCYLKVYQNGNVISTSDNGWLPGVSCTGTSAELSIDLSKSQYKDGKYKFDLYVNDKAGNYKTAGPTSEVVYDTTAPVINSFTVLKSLTNTKNVVLKASITESVSGIKECILNVFKPDASGNIYSNNVFSSNDINICNSLQNVKGYNYTINSGEGTYSFYFTVKDNVDLSSETKTLTVTYDTSAPQGYKISVNKIKDQFAKITDIKLNIQNIDLKLNDKMDCRYEVYYNSSNTQPANANEWGSPINGNWNNNWNNCTAEKFPQEKEFALANGDGYYKIFMFMKDEVGNEYPWKKDDSAEKDLLANADYADIIVLDTTNPNIITFKLQNAAESELFANSLIQVSYNIEDMLSGIDLSTSQIYQDNETDKDGNVITQGTNIYLKEIGSNNNVDFSLVGGDGVKQINFKLLDNAGNSNSSIKSICLDKTSPNITNFEITGNERIGNVYEFGEKKYTKSGVVDLKYNFTDSSCKDFTVAGPNYKCRHRNKVNGEISFEDWVDCNSETKNYIDDDKNIYDKHGKNANWPLADPKGENIVDEKEICLQVKDEAGNEGETVCRNVTLDKKAPVNNIQIFKKSEDEDSYTNNDGYTNNKTVILNLTTDFDVVQYKIKILNETESIINETDWIGIETGKLNFNLSYELSHSLKDDGSKNVFFVTKDRAGNENEIKYNDSINLDRGIPKVEPVDEGYVSGIDVCNNNKTCDSGETFKNCPEDCPEEDNGGGITEEGEEEDTEDVVQEDSSADAILGAFLKVIDSFGFGQKHSIQVSEKVFVRAGVSNKEKEIPTIGPDVTLFITAAKDSKICKYSTEKDFNFKSISNYPNDNKPPYEKGAFTQITRIEGMNNWTAALSGLEDGPHVYYAKCKDKAGNIGTLTEPIYFVTDKNKVTVPAVVSPSGDVSNVPINNLFSIVFSKPMNANSLYKSISFDKKVNASFYWDIPSNSLEIYLRENLKYSTTYKVTINSTASDIYGNNMSNIHTFSFTTEAVPIPPVCSGNISLEFDSYSVYPGDTFTATISGLKNCENDNIELRNENCKGKVVIFWKPSEGDSKTIISEAAEKNYVYAACVNKSGVGNDTKTLIVSKIHVDTCDDSTVYEECSETQPKKCINGELLDYSSECGCPTGFIEKIDETCGSMGECTKNEDCDTTEKCENTLCIPKDIKLTRDQVEAAIKAAQEAIDSAKASNRDTSKAEVKLIEAKMALYSFNLEQAMTLAGEAIVTLKTAKIIMKPFIFPIWILIPVFVGVIVALVYWIKLKKIKVMDEIKKLKIGDKIKILFKKKEKKADPKIVQYVKGEMEKGFTKDEIKKVMLEAGYTREEIDSAFKEAGK